MSFETRRTEFTIKRLLEEWEDRSEYKIYEFDDSNDNKRIEPNEIRVKLQFTFTGTDRTEVRRYPNYVVTQEEISEIEQEIDRQLDAASSDDENS